MKPATHAEALKVQAALGDGFRVVEFDASTKTSADAASAVGCSVAQIAKSIIFKTVKDARPVLVIASGINRVDDKKLSNLLGERVKSADADFVLRATGFAPGGVPPVGHETAPAVFIDEDLRAVGALWAAGGTPNAVFEISFEHLVRLTAGTVANVAKAR